MPQEFKASMHEMRGEMLLKNNMAVEEFIRDVHLMLKAKGWKYEGQSLQSALYDRRYTKGEFNIAISGWHGTGKRGTCRWFGDSKSFLGLWHCKGFKSDFDIRVNLHDCDTFQEIIDRQDRGMAEALKFIAQL